ncbi:M15 family metallopeptidase [Actinomadura luteofluorescens]|nr:D-alanyl-D-alanine dipeptidase [Actinomadura glauciflava]
MLGGLPPVVPPALGGASPRAVALPPIRETGVPLRRVADRLTVLPVYSWLNLPGAPSDLLLREEALDRLCRAERRLPPGFGIVVIDGWRSRAFQTELRKHYSCHASPELGDFVADPDSSRQIPPHVTGGAADLTLSWSGTALGLGTDFDSFTPEAAVDAFEGHTGGEDIVRDLRRLLSCVLSAEGFIADPLEWWHWSYGDQWWAKVRNVTTAPYGELT